MWHDRCFNTRQPSILSSAKTSVLWTVDSTVAEQYYCESKWVGHLCTTHCPVSFALTNLTDSSAIKYRFDKKKDIVVAVAHGLVKAHVSKILKVSWRIVP